MHRLCKINYFQEKVLLPCCILLLAGMFCLSFSLTDHPPEKQASSEWDVHDFPVFWIAWQIYHSEEHLYTQKNFHHYRSDSNEVPDNMHNPPWVLWLIAPVAWLPYPLALACWQIWNFGLILLNIFLALKLMGRPPPTPKMLFALCFFGPAISCWYFGQLAITLTSICLLLLHCLQRKWFWAAGACLALMTAKPQIYFLLAFAIGLQALYQKRWQLFAGFGIMQGILMLPFVLGNSSFTDWVAYLPEGDAPQLMTATLSTWVRIWTLSYNPIAAEWPLIVIPLLALLGITFFMLYKIAGQRAITDDWSERAIPLIALSLLLAPYAWPYDFSLLILWHAYMLYSTKSTLTMRVISLLASSIFLLQLCWIHTELHFLAWYPAAAAVSYILCLALRKRVNLGTTRASL